MLSRLSRLCSALVVLTGAARASANFQGNLPYELYSDGDGCTESNFVGTGTILSLTVMDEATGTFCETDILDPAPPEFPDSSTVYTKILVGGCDGETGAVDVRFWECATSDCSECTPLVRGTTTGSNFTAARDNLTECFYGWPSASVSSDGGLTPVIGYQIFERGMGATQSQDEEFFDLLISNSCMAGMASPTTGEAPTIYGEAPTSGSMQVVAAGYISAGIAVALSFLCV